MDSNLAEEGDKCGAAVPREGAAVRKETKRPPEDAAPPAAELKLAKKEVVESSMAKGRTGPVVCPMGMVLDIVGMARGDHGQSCENHEICGVVLEEDVVVSGTNSHPQQAGEGI